MLISKKPKAVLLVVAALLFVAIFFTLIQSSSSASAFDGDGSEDFPFLITDAADLQSFLALAGVATEKYALAADIDLTGITVSPASDFFGELDGRGYLIEGLVIAAEGGDNAALFAANSGIIKNLRVSCEVTSTAYSAGIAAENAGIIENCAVSGEVFSHDSAGGVCGENNGTVVNSYNTAFINGTALAGGIAAINNGVIESCYNSEVVSSAGASAGIAAVNADRILYCYNTADISLHPLDALLSYYIGGLAAQSGGAVSDSYNIGNIRVFGDYDVYSGAIIGLMNSASGSVANCYYDGLTQVDANASENKGGWQTQGGYTPIDTCVRLSTLEMSGGTNSLTFNDVLYWTYLADNLTEEKVFYPQLSCFYDSVYAPYSFDSINSVEKHYDTCLVTLRNDYGDLITQYTVFSGESEIPSPIEKQGFLNAGWSASLDGARLAEGTLVLTDITLYAVYAFMPLEYSFSPVTATYGDNLSVTVSASHECADAVINFQWYKSGDTLDLLDGATDSQLILTQVSQSGFYQCRATAVCGKYSAYAYDTQKVTIKPFEISVLTPVFAKTYGDDDSSLVQRYTVDTGFAQEEISIVYTREEGENVGYYDILSAYSENGNFNITLIGDAEDKFIINKADYTYSFNFIVDVFVYDGETHMLDYISDLSIGLSAEITMIGDGVSAGEHQITATFSGDFDNYNVIEPVQEIMRISKANYNMQDVHFYDVAEIYDGGIHNVYMSGLLPEGVEVVFSLNNLRDAGQYTTSITFTGDYNNYNTIPPRQADITILPKGLQPEFHLPESMVEDGQAKAISIAAPGVVSGDEVTFEALSVEPLVEAGSYVITAVCDNDNYILYNNTLVVYINAAEISNSGDESIDMRISSSEGLRSDCEFIAESAFLSNDILSELGASALKTVFNLRLLVGEEDIDPDSELTVTLTIPEGYVGAQSIKFYFYDAETQEFELMNIELESRELSFDTHRMGFFVLSVVPAASAPTDQPDAAGGWLRPTLYILLGVIVALSLLLAFLIANGKKKIAPAPETPTPRKPLFEPLPEERSALFRAKISRGEFVDWELNRDLKLYGTYAKDKLDSQE